MTRGYELTLFIFLDFFNWILIFLIKFCNFFLSTFYICCYINIVKKILFNIHQRLDSYLR